MNVVLLYYLLLSFNFVLLYAGNTEISLKSILKETSQYQSVQQMNYLDSLKKQRDTLTVSIENHQREVHIARKPGVSHAQMIYLKHQAGLNLYQNLSQATRQQEEQRCCACSQRADLQDIVECTYAWYCSCICCFIPICCREIPVNYFNDRIKLLAEQDCSQLEQRIQALKPQTMEERHAENKT